MIFFHSYSVTREPRVYSLVIRKRKRKFTKFEIKINYKEKLNKYESLLDANADLYCYIYILRNISSMYSLINSVNNFVIAVKS